MLEQPSPAYSAEVRARVGQSLRTARRGSQQTMSQSLSVTTRTLRSWKKLASEGKRPSKRGRKKSVSTLGELLAITREWERQGRPGSRPIIAALPGIRVRLIRDVVAGLKQ